MQTKYSVKAYVYSFKSIPKGRECTTGEGCERIDENRYEFKITSGYDKNKAELLTQEQVAAIKSLTSNYEAVAASRLIQ